MNIIIPAAGQGARFAQDGYATPKPLINVLGEPMIFHVIRSLKAGALDTIHIVYTQDLDRYSFRSMLKKEFPDASLHFILLKYRTRGPVETVLCGLNQIGDLDNQVLVLDCDTFYLDDILGVSREEQENFLFYFTDTHPDAIFSYIQIKDGRVSDICEKEKISDHACTGAYGFRSGRELKKYCERVLNSENKARGEYYISSVYAEMINDGAAVISYPVENFHCLGTPQQLQTYCAGHGAAPKRFCFDLDGTLVTFPETPGDYRNAQPIVRNIRFVQYLHKQGHTIIIQTARKMLSSQHNAGQAARLAYQDVFATLEKYEIPFDEIYFGKPFAHFYIDDLSVKPFHMEQETGFYNTHVEARHFNRIEYRGSYVIKTTSNPGEVYWYRHIPESVRDHFPKVLETQGNRLTLEWIDGIVFSYLLVNNSLTRQNIGNLLETVGKLHTCAQVPDSQIDYNANYNAKMWERYQGFDYRSMSRESECYYKEIADHVATIEGLGNKEM